MDPRRGRRRAATSVARRACAAATRPPPHRGGSARAPALWRRATPRARPGSAAARRRDRRARRRRRRAASQRDSAIARSLVCAGHRANAASASSGWPVSSSTWPRRRCASASVGSSVTPADRRSAPYRQAVRPLLPPPLLRGCPAGRRWLRRARWAPRAPRAASRAPARTSGSRGKRCCARASGAWICGRSPRSCSSQTESSVTNWLAWARRAICGSGPAASAPRTPGRRLSRGRVIGDVPAGAASSCLHQVDELERELSMRFGDVAAILGLGLDRRVDVQRRRRRHRRRPRLEDALELGRLLGPGAPAVGDAAEHLAGQLAQILAGAIAEPRGRIARHVGDRLGLIAGW